MKQPIMNQPILTDQRAVLMKKYDTSRYNLLLVVVFTLINTVLQLTGSDTYFLFSAVTPMRIAALGLYFAENTGLIAFTVVAMLLVLLILVAYLLCWLFSKKSVGWLIAALVLFSVDCVHLAYIMVVRFLDGGFDGSFTIDIVFHALILYYLISGIVTHSKLKKLPPEQAEEPTAETMLDGVAVEQTQEQTNN